MESGAPVLVLSLFWLFWLLLLLIALYCVLLDIRFLRLQFSLHERELYEETLGSEQFRKAIIEAQREQMKSLEEPKDG